MATTPPEGFTPEYDNDGTTVMHYEGPTVEGDGWNILTSWSPDSGFLLWPARIGGDEQFTPAQALQMGRALITTSEKYGAQWPD